MIGPKTVRYAVFDDREPATWRPWHGGNDLSSIENSAHARPDSIRPTWDRVTLRLKLAASDQLLRDVTQFSEYVGSVIDVRRLHGDFDRLRREHRDLVIKLSEATNPSYRAFQYQILTLLHATEETASDKERRLDAEARLADEARDLLGVRYVEPVIPIAAEGDLEAFLAHEKTRLAAKAVLMRHEGRPP